MISERKRKPEVIVASANRKRAKPISETPVRRDLLERCYGRVFSLREYVLSQLPQRSRIRRKKVASIHELAGARETEKTLSRLLDTSLVCFANREGDNDDTRWGKWLAFSQREDESYVSLSDGISGSIFSQNEIVDFVVWLLFSRDVQVGRRPKHLLCDGFRKSAGPEDQGTTNIPGLFSLYPNSNVQVLREAPWPQLLALLGKAGEKIMINLLVDASIYLAVEAGFNNYHQLTGVPLAELDLPGDITLVRSRIFYAKPSLTAKGLVQPGYKRIHVLNRYTSVSKSQDATVLCQGTVKVMMYIFPRQFGLHNVFTSQVDPTETSQKFQDYTLREEEIASAFQKKGGDTAPRMPKIPKRLRGDTEQLVERLQVLHGRCSYVELLKHYCPCAFDRPSRSRKLRTKKGPIPSRKAKPLQYPTTISSYKCAPSQKHPELGLSSTQEPSLPNHESLVDLATPLSQVSSFCQAVLSKIVPKRFWGDDTIQKHNKSVIMRNVDHFIRLKRFETMSLHEITQDIKIANIAWLQPPGLGDQKSNKTDSAKRVEIFHEFIYFVFDSLLMPLIRNNFYVTESNTHRYQVFYFRHEVWRQISEPAMAALRADMFEEVKLDDALEVLRSRKLGFSQIRLLPKGNKLRPIMNLRRPVHSLLKLEKRINPSKLGSTMFSVSDIYTRLKLFKQSLGSEHGKLYFVKTDVKAAFDTIPQEAVVSLMKSVPSQAEYTIMKHAEVKPGERAPVDDAKSLFKAIRRWYATALSEKENPDFIARLEQDLASKKKNTVFVGSALRSTQNVAELMHLLRQHVEHNLIKVGKKYYRQKVGIPQGSVLSSFLYQEKAIKFVNSMHLGFPEYGVAVNPTKTMVNFDMLYHGEPVQKANHEKGFPYCGTTINCQTLDIAKDRETNARIDISSSLTVDFGRTPGQNFQRKVLNAFKIQSHLMFYDTSHNSSRTVLNSLRGAFVETASKMWAYMRCLGKTQHPNSEMILRTIAKVIDIAFMLLTTFEKVLAVKQSNYQPVVKWLRKEADRLASAQKTRLARVS
ncbi:telomerase reverse transcriptase [Fusarium beomiforme]|uniref:Telomerase reverse transcriptase n=1 Tax=Fusarium beomiforme TaxID=44412 RepID=A0A9P5ABT1_9HYPO|nr:telomerase reverse transcriptase [Fusarium beomiforme]